GLLEAVRSSAGRGDSVPCVAGACPRRYKEDSPEDSTCSAHAPRVVEKGAGAQPVLHGGLYRRGEGNQPPPAPIPPPPPSSSVGLPGPTSRSPSSDRTRTYAGDTCSTL